MFSCVVPVARQKTLIYNETPFIPDLYIKGGVLVFFFFLLKIKKKNQNYVLLFMYRPISSAFQKANNHDYIKVIERFSNKFLNIGI